MAVLDSILIAVAAIVLCCLLLYVLQSRGLLERRGLSPSPPPAGPFLMWKTVRGRQLIDRIARRNVFWRWFGDLAIVLVAVTMVGTTVLLLWEATLVQSSAVRANPPSPELLLGLPAGAAQSVDPGRRLRSVHGRKRDLFCHPDRAEGRHRPGRPGDPRVRHGHELLPSVDEPGSLQRHSRRRPVLHLPAVPRPLPDRPTDGAVLPRHGARGRRAGAVVLAPREHRVLALLAQRYARGDERPPRGAAPRPLHFQGRGRGAPLPDSEGHLHGAARPNRDECEPRLCVPDSRARRLAVHRAADLTPVTGRPRTRRVR